MGVGEVQVSSIKERKREKKKKKKKKKVYRIERGRVNENKYNVFLSAQSG